MKWAIIKTNFGSKNDLQNSPFMYVYEKNNFRIGYFEN